MCLGQAYGYSPRISMGAGIRAEVPPGRHSGCRSVCPGALMLLRLLGCCSANTSFLVWWTRSQGGSDLKASIWLLQYWQEVFWLMELHPFSPKRLECVRTVSLKQSNCQSLAWKWVLAMCELCQGREGGKPWQAASFLLTLSLTCLPSAVPPIFHGLAYKISALTRLVQIFWCYWAVATAGWINHKLLLLVERQVCIVIIWVFLFSVGFCSGIVPIFRPWERN